MHSEFDIDRDWQPDRRGPVRWILSHASRYKLWMVGMLVGALGNAALAAALPVLTGRAFDVVSARPSDLAGLAQVAGLIVLSQLVRGLALQMMRNLCSETIGQRMERDVRDELYISLAGKSMSFHDSQSTGDLMARATNDVREINMMFNPGVNLVVGSANFLLMPIFIAPTIHLHLILTPLVYLGAYFFLVRSYLSELRPVAEDVRRMFGWMNTRLVEAIEGVETVKGAAQEEREVERFVGAVAGWRDAYLTQADVEARFIPLLLLGLLQAAGFAHSLLLFRSGAIGVGDVISFNGLLLLFGFPTFAAQFAYSRVSSGIASARRILELINARTELGQNEAGYDAPMEGAVVFQDVTFCYDTGEETCQPDAGVTLEQISFRVESGQTVAVVGQTGSGKSTIAKLINRTYDVDGGGVLVDGVDVRDWNLEALRRQISIIEQDIFLFSRTVAENIGFGCPEATREQIEAAARAAQAHEFILGFKEGYETVIGERGVTLSGGQRQRLALARAFLTQPAILILDDATSAIDSETEDRIQRAIERVSQGRTTFLITHRLSQIRWADLIIVMRQGRVAAVGAHEELLETSPAYRNIFTRYER
ncbi:MAG TPA: ABC transporter ATP-binding protein [Chloroflexi bacterium]|nr:ABC transporter ATP-binding protein [Chloroflexota bacterium]